MMAIEREPDPEITLASASLASEEKLIGLRLVGLGLWTRIRHPAKRHRGRHALDFGPLIRGHPRESADDVLEIDRHQSPSSSAGGVSWSTVCARSPFCRMKATRRASSSDESSLFSSVSIGPPSLPV